MEVKNSVLERRRHARVAVDAYVTARLIINDLWKGRVFISRDISSEGIFLFTEQPFPIGTIFNLTIQTPSAIKGIKTESRVVRVGKDVNSRITGMGLFFTRTNDIDKRELVKHLYLAYHYIED